MTANLAGFGVVILVLSILFSSGCMKGDVISETEIQQKNQWWEDDSQNHLVEIIQTLMYHLFLMHRWKKKSLFYQP